MSFATLSCLALLLVPLQPPALELVNPRATYGHLGARRPKTGILPGDVVHFTFEAKNLTLDANNKASYSIAIEIRDGSGKIFFEQRPYNAVAQNFLGGVSLPCSAFVEIPLDAKPGDVEWKVTVVDRATKKSASLQGSGKILPADFGIVQVGLFGDAEGRVPVSAVAVVGDTAYLRHSIVGFGIDKDKKHPHVKVSMRIVDDKGQPTMPKPLVGAIGEGVSADEKVVPVQFAITMNRPGRFTIELTAEDAVTGKRATIQYGLRVLDSE